MKTYAMFSTEEGVIQGSEILVSGPTTGGDTGNHGFVGSLCLCGLSGPHRRTTGRMLLLSALFGLPLSHGLKSERWPWCWGHPLAPQAVHDKVSGLKDLKSQGSWTIRPHHRGTWMFRVSVPKSIPEAGPVSLKGQ